MKNINVSLKMVISYVTMILLCVCICVVGIVGVGRLRDEMTSFYEEVVMAIDYIGRGRENLQEQRVLVLELAMVESDEGARRLVNTINKNKGEMRGYLDNYRANILQSASIGNQEILSVENVERLERFNTLYEEYFVKEIDQIIAEAGNLSNSHALSFVTSSNVNEMLDIMTVNIDFYTQIAEEGVREANQLREQIVTITVIATVLSVLICGFYSLYLPLTIARPMRRMVYAANAVSVGDMTFDIHNDPSRRDEVGRLALALDRMRDAISNQVNIVESLANADLNVEPTLRSDKDTLGMALVKLSSNLDRIIADVSTASESVAQESNHVAMESQELAQGTTEQAASVEELSSAFYEISLNTKENASLAGKAASLSEDVKQMAIEGASLMDRMTQAVRETDAASKSIEKIIKTIEEISFQTNILALNAAVEAAHAGQNGSGFAVVASEVRSLASKSTASSKETSELIANALEKVQLGAEIATQTSSSFKKIMDGVVESSRLVDDIAKSSEEQALAIEQINTGISQVAQVIHLNSGAAEKTAASAEKMNRQARVLEQTVSMFRQKAADVHVSAPADMPLDEPVVPQLHHEQVEAPAHIDLSPSIPNDDFGKY